MKYQKLIDTYRDKKSLPDFDPERRAVEDQLFTAFISEINIISEYNKRTKVRKSTKLELETDSWIEPAWMKEISS